MEDREFWIEMRRLLIAGVGFIERRYQIAPSPPRYCAGCDTCERKNRHQRDLYMTARERGENVAAPPVN